ncbi:unnamed protein product [Symbiodinium sp. CCMP2592]|nr:unnamed protein product [Symbiodinium sp. CCMP2592]
MTAHPGQLVSTSLFSSHTSTTITRFSPTTTFFQERSLAAAILLVFYLNTGILVPGTWLWHRLPLAVSQNSIVGESLVIQGEHKHYEENFSADYEDLFFVDFGNDLLYNDKGDFFVDYQSDFSVDYQIDFSVDYKNNSSVDYLHNVFYLVPGKRPMATSSAPTSGIPLHEYRRDVPPGWGPNLPDYSLKTFFERLKMWYRLYDGPDETVGPLVAGRLVGKAQKLALALRLPRPDGQVDIGSDALVRLPVDEVRDPANPQVILQHSIVSGIQALCNKLRETFGHTDQEMAQKSLESLFELRRGKLTLQEYAVEFDTRMEEAHERAGLEMNEVAHYYFFFKNSGLPQRLMDDIRLQVHGDLRRYQEARSLALRLSTKNEGETFYQDDDLGGDTMADRESWDSSWWSDGWDEYYDESLYDHSSWYGEDDYYGEDEEQDGQWQEDGEGAGDDLDGGDVSWDYPVKGGKGKKSRGNAMGVGCSVCGSKWHNASSCPVGGKTGKGGYDKGGYPGKGSGKGYGNKGYGGKGTFGKNKGGWRPWNSSKGKSFGKRPSWGFGSKGKSKGKGWRGYAEYPDGYSHDKTLAAHFGTDTFSAFPAKTSSSRPMVFDMDKGEPEILGKRTVTFETAETEAAETDEAPTEGATQNKGLDFHFPVALYADREHFHMIGGNKRRGLLVDPGASNGLIGSETLRDIMDTCLTAKTRPKVQWSDKVANVSGISGAQNQTLGEVTLPLGFGEEGRGTFTADVLGGEGSLCPALLSNPALRKMCSVIYSNFFDNGDGLIACTNKSEEPHGTKPSWHYFRLLLTDSGHYLLPVDMRPNLVSEEVKVKAGAFMASAAKAARNKWGDVRHCFYGTGNAELERSEVYHGLSKGATQADDHSVHRDPAEVQADDHSVPRDPAEVQADDHSVPRDPAEVQADDHSVPTQDDDQVSGESGPLCQVKHPSVRGIFLLSKDDPRQVWSASDEWTLFGDVLVRHHHIPRRAMFTPACTKDCPVDPALLSDYRETTWRQGGHSKVYKDSWRQAAHPHRDLGHMWTGQTKFKLKKEATNPKASEAASETDLEMPWDDFAGYKEDIFPEHWSSTEVKQHAQRYVSMEEEYYTKTKRRPVTPKNFSTWFSRCMGRGLRWQFQELFSGSGRLSLLAVMSGLMVGFPIDHRYGWDLAMPDHQAMVKQARDEFLPYYMYASPTSSPWQSSSNEKTPHLLLPRQAAERPALEFLRSLCQQQAQDGLRFGEEQPRNSTLFQSKNSPLHEIYYIPGTRKKQQVDQCYHGCVNHDSHPVKKSTTIVSNIKHHNTAKRCSGHHGESHAVINGSFAGASIINKTVVYPRRMCRAIVEDVWKSLKASGVIVQQWPNELLLHADFSGYKCERCQLGRAALPFMEHTLIPGECRYGRRPPGENPRLPLRPIDPLSTFKRKARDKDLSGISLGTPADIFLPVQASLYLKYTLLMVVQDTVAIFSEAVERGLEYVHWLTDPVHKTMFQEIFQKEMNVKGIACAIRPFHCLVPEPKLSPRAAPLRLQIRGDVKNWKVMELEDLRLLSHSQQHQRIEEIDWLITLFGSSVRILAGHRSRASSSKDDLPTPASKDDLPPDPEEIEEETFEGAPQQPIKPLYSFKKVFKRLRQIAESDPLTAKRLILGLHERFYHAPLGDLRNLLARCGMPGEVLSLVPDAVKGCAVCRKYVRLPNRPQVKVTSSNVFNERVQMDLFQYAGKWVCLLIDEATRYKIGFLIADKGWKEITRMLLSTWMMYFGPPAFLVADQESSVMSHEASADLERFCITRCPRGTTSGTAGKQHTGTGLVERHVALTELTMRKLASELNRQGLYSDVDELAREATMAQNLSLNFGGVTPAMAVLGVLPRPFFDVATDNVMSDAGALQTDLSQFERALRVRQIAMACIQQAISEDRVARANRTRTNQLDIGSLVPGTSSVDIYREVAGDVGWRGPAELLKIDAQEGNAVVQYQGRPYLVGLRHLRLHEATSFVVLPEDVQNSIRELRTMAEAQRPYKVSIVGWILDHSDQQHVWRRSSSSFSQYEEIMQHATAASRHFSDRPFGGVAIGQGVRHLRPPPHSVGVLMLWAQGAEQYVFEEHWDSSIVKIKDMVPFPVEDACFLYFFFYNHVEDEVRPSSLKGSGDSIPLVPMELDSTEPAMDTSDLIDHKRKGPETRSVVLGPEDKKQRTDALVLQALYAGGHDIDYLQQLHWLSNANRKVKLDPQHHALAACNSPLVSLLDAHMYRDAIPPSLHGFSETTRPLVTWPGKLFSTFHVDLQDGSAFKVDTDTDIISESDVFPIWDKVEEADRKELLQFIETKSFRKVIMNTLSEDTVVIDATWVRKWKRKADGSLVVKSRLCARGCFDPHREHLTTRSTTATRLSQRIVLSTAATHQMDCESFDISGAFLKGFTFEKVRQLLRARGIVSPVRKVVIIPPANVWRHLAQADSSFETYGDYISFGLACDKPVYGLNDAPLAWQLCLHEFLKKHGGFPSLLDENLFIWKTPPPENKLKALVSTHVDDLATAAFKAFMNWLFETLKKEFGSVTRQTMPFDHCGCRYERTADGYRMSQKHFAEKLVETEIAENKDDDTALTPAELTTFRSILGGLLWLTATRMDIISDVALLQSQVTKARICHLRLANRVVQKAKHPDYIDLGLHYRFLHGNLRLLCIHDASSANKDRNYAQEGILVLLCEDNFNVDDGVYKMEASDELVRNLGGKAHVLWSHGAKAKRVSYSTSHAETLAAIGGLETVSLVAIRLSELMFEKGQPTLKDLMSIQENGNPLLPVDAMTDCRDFYELTTGERTLPQDKGQRLYVLAHKEARICGRIRWMILVPTESMTADALTKPMISPPLLHLMSCGLVEFKNEDGHPLLLRRLPPIKDVNEDTILEKDDVLVKNFLVLLAASMYKVSKPFMLATVMATQVTSTSASTTSTTSSTSPTSSSDMSWWWNDATMFWLVTILAIITVERLALHGLLRGVNTLWALLPSRPTSFSTSSTTSSTSSTSTQTDQVFVHNLVENRKHIILSDEIAYKESEIRRLREQISVLNNRGTGEADDLRVQLQLKDEQLRKLERRIKDHFISCTSSMTLTVAQCSRCWHRNGFCGQFKKGSKLKELTTDIFERLNLGARRMQVSFEHLKSQIQALIKQHWNLMGLTQCQPQVVTDACLSWALIRGRDFVLLVLEGECGIGSV